MDTNAGQLAKRTRAEKAYDALKNDILRNKIAAGTQATEPELSLQFGVSRTTIREALIRLEAEGLVEMIPRRGARILPMDADDMREIYEILISLEADAAFGLATRGLSSDDLDRLHAANVRMTMALHDQDLTAWAEADEVFHRTFLEMHGNRRLGRIVQSLSDQAHRARMVTLSLRPMPEQSVAEHIGILDAVKARDGERAREAYRAHRQRAASEILRILEKLPRL
jgi:DNA-binding GntR family transcriptional regulator